MDTENDIGRYSESSDGQKWEHFERSHNKAKKDKPGPYMNHKLKAARSHREISLPSE